VSEVVGRDQESEDEEIGRCQSCRDHLLPMGQAIVSDVRSVKDAVLRDVP